MFIYELEKEIERDIEKRAFDGWFECAARRRPLLDEFPTVGDLIDGFREHDGPYTERHNNILESLMLEARDCPHDGPVKILIYIFVPMLVRIAEKRKPSSGQTKEDIHDSVIFHFLESAADYPLDRLRDRIFGNLKRRLENRLRDNWIEEDRNRGELEYLDACKSGAHTDPSLDETPFECVEERDSVRWLLTEARRKGIIDDDDLEILVKNHACGLSLKAIAKEKNLSFDCVKKRHQRAKKALREHFQNIF